MHTSVLPVAGLERILILFYTFIVSHIWIMCPTETYILHFSNIYMNKKCLCVCGSSILSENKDESLKLWVFWYKNQEKPEEKMPWSCALILWQPVVLRMDGQCANEVTMSS